MKLEEDYVDVDEENVRLLLGIPSGLKLVDEMNSSNIEDEKYAGVLGIFKNRYGELAPIVTKTPVVVSEQVDRGDNFKRDFIIYINSSLINRPATRRCRYRLMEIFLETSDIKNYN